MDDITKYVDKLFIKQKQTQYIIDLKSELISNIEARIEDNINRGLDYKSAFKEATANIKTADSFLTSTRKINIISFVKELLEFSLIILLITWIFTTVVSINRRIFFTNIIVLLGIICNIIAYIIVSIINKKNASSTVNINIIKAKKLTRIIWILWTAFILIKTATTIAIRFGSNIWFGRAIKIDGPYQLSLLIMELILPLISIIIPLLFNIATKIIHKHEVNLNE